MKYFVKGYCGFNEGIDDLVCIDEDGIRHNIDLLVNGDLDEGMRSKDLIGKYVEVEFLQPFLSLGHGVKVIDAPTEKPND